MRNEVYHLDSKRTLGLVRYLKKLNISKQLTKCNQIKDIMLAKINFYEQVSIGMLMLVIFLYIVGLLA